MVGWLGLEPRTNGLKGRCSTIELPTHRLHQRRRAWNLVEGDSTVQVQFPGIDTFWRSDRGRLGCVRSGTQVLPDRRLQPVECICDSVAKSKSVE